jgi:exodeoxyribonuclease-3
MNIVSYNVNGIRAAIAKGLLDWIDEHPFDIVCVQETKAHSGSVPVLLIESLGYQHHWHSAKRKGYSGVATFSKQRPTLIEKGMGIPEFDDEGRVLRTDFGELTVVNCYFPNGSSRPERQAYKMRFLQTFAAWVEELQHQRPNLIVVGDFNIARQAIDVYQSARHQGSSGFLPEEREWLQRWLDTGFVDAFRKLHPLEISYSWWSNRGSARENNQGWRIDYQAVSQHLGNSIRAVSHLRETIHSDHCPVLLEIDLD